MQSMLIYKLQNLELGLKTPMKLHHKEKSVNKSVKTTAKIIRTQTWHIKYGQAPLGVAKAVTANVECSVLLKGTCFKLKILLTILIYSRMERRM